MNAKNCVGVGVVGVQRGHEGGVGQRLWLELLTSRLIPTCMTGVALVL